MVKDLSLLLLWSRFNAWPRNFHMLQVWPKNKTKQNKSHQLITVYGLIWILSHLDCVFKNAQKQTTYQKAREDREI